MSEASEIVLGAGNRIKTEADVVKYPDRYSDPRGVEIWNRVLRIIGEIKAEINSTYSLKMTNNTELSRLIRIINLSLAKNHPINHHGQQIHGNHHFLCNNLYHNFTHGHQNNL
jgi:hypothetical protein